MTVAPLLATLLVVSTPPPQPPPQLQPWVEYARALGEGSEAGCPPTLGCVPLQRVELEGRPASGRLTLRLLGESFARVDYPLPLVARADKVAVTAVRWLRGKGFVRLDGDGAWTADVAPGRFALQLELSFEAGEALRLELSERASALAAGAGARRDEGGDVVRQVAQEPEGM